MPTVIRRGFEWDSVKAAINLKKHHVSFEEAETAFSDPLAIYDPTTYSTGSEVELTIIGFSVKTRLLIAVHVERGVRTRIISARAANRREEKIYEKQGSK